MNQRIIYPTDDGGVAVLIPADCGLTIEEIAAKDVLPIVTHGPEGSIVSSTPRPFQIVDVADIPADRTFRGAWSWEN